MWTWGYDHISCFNLSLTGPQANHKLDGYHHFTLDSKSSVSMLDPVLKCPDSLLKDHVAIPRLSFTERNPF